MNSTYISHDHNLNRQKIDSISSIKTKEELRNNLKKNLISKYFTKIIEDIKKDISKGNNKCTFYYNYYDFTNKKMGHPHLIVNEILYEMTYEYSEFIQDKITLKSLFGNNFKWSLKSKNIIIFEW